VPDFSLNKSPSVFPSPFLFCGHSGLQLSHGVLNMELWFSNSPLFPVFHFFSNRALLFPPTPETKLKGPYSAAFFFLPPSLLLSVLDQSTFLFTRKPLFCVSLFCPVPCTRGKNVYFLPPPPLQIPFFFFPSENPNDGFGPPGFFFFTTRTENQVSSFSFPPPPFFFPTLSPSSPPDSRPGCFLRPFGS